VVLRSGQRVAISPKPSLERAGAMPHAFVDEWAWHDYYKQKAVAWGKINWDTAISFTLKKAAVLLVSVEKTPLTAGSDVPAELTEIHTSRGKKLEFYAVQSWLLAGRVLEVMLVCLGALLVIRGGAVGIALTASALLALIAYGLPCVIGFCFERHVTPFLVMIASCVSVMIAEVAQSENRSSRRFQAVAKPTELG
jgi:hypothetical protein